MADWQKIKTEYITTDTSYRKLAEKYGVSRVQIGNVGAEEKWVELRRQHLDKTLTKAVDRICENKVDRAARLNSVAELLLEKVERLLESDGMINVDTQGMKHISGVLKDIKEIQMIKSDADMREQEARIANLRKQAESESENNEPVRVIIEDDLKKYSK
jgi:hypothetical protein